MDSGKCIIVVMGSVKIQASPAKAVAVSTPARLILLAWNLQLQESCQLPPCKNRAKLYAYIVICSYSHIVI